MNPFDNPEVFEKFIVVSPSMGRLEFPGTAHVKMSGGLKEDSRTVPGEDGSTVTALGFDLRTFTVQLKIISGQEYEQLRQVLKLFKRGKPLEELEVIYPSLDIMDIQRAYLFDVDLPEFKQGDEYEPVFFFKEWRPEVKKTASSSAGGTKVIGQDVPPLSSLSGSAPNPPLPSNSAVEVPDGVL